MIIYRKFNMKIKILGVGAYVSPAMQDTEYTMGRKTQPIAYTWSSRGKISD